MEEAYQALGIVAVFLVIVGTCVAKIYQERGRYERYIDELETYYEATFVDKFAKCICTHYDKCPYHDDEQSKELAAPPEPEFGTLDSIAAAELARELAKQEAELRARQAAAPRIRKIQREAARQKKKLHF